MYICTLKHTNINVFDNSSILALENQTPITVYYHRYPITFINNL